MGVTNSKPSTPQSSKVWSVAILGSGPAALMAADVLSTAPGIEVSIFEKRKSAGRKLLIAGSSGLNISNSLPVPEFIKHYSGPADLWKKLLSDFSPQDWLKFIEDLGMATFEGTSGRYFVKEMKASKLLRAWLDQLKLRKVEFHYDHECVGFARKHSNKVELTFADKDPLEFDAVCFGLGGGSYEPSEKPLRWPAIFLEKKLGFTSFTPSNVGYQVEWNASFLKEAEGLPLKNIKLTSSKGSRLGDVVITQYGLEGTPVYFMGTPGQAELDLKPDLSVSQILKKCQSTKENLSPLRRVKKQLAFCPGTLALLFHFAPKAALEDMNKLAQLIKSFPILFHQSRDLDEAISSAGGLHLNELDDQFMLKNYPGVFAIGEMLDWDAPTGGFLIQGCVSQGFRAGYGVLGFLRRLGRTDFNR